MQRQLLQEGAATDGVGTLGAFGLYQSGRFGARLMELRPDLRKGHACYAARGTVQKKYHQEDRFLCPSLTSPSPASTSYWEKLNKMCHDHGKTGPEEHLSIVTQEGKGPHEAEKHLVDQPLATWIQSSHST